MNRDRLILALRAMVRLALPLVVVQVAFMAMGVTDTIMVGRVSPEAIAAVALGHLYFFGVAIFGSGFLMALDPVVAQAVGAGDRVGVARGVQRGLLLAGILVVVASVALIPAGPILELLRQPTDVVPIASAYARVSIAGIIPFYGFIVLRQCLQAMHHTRPIVVTAVMANLANVVLNWMMIFGHWGFPAMGAVGAAWATALSRWIMAGGLLWAGWKPLREYVRPWRTDVVAWGPLLAMGRLGLPIGVQQQLEYGVFGVVGLLMGWLGTVPMAGHQLALNLASITFMVPLGVSGAAAVLVGNAVGRGDGVGARDAAVASLICGVGFMAVSAMVMFTVPGVLARIYTTEPDVAAVAVALIPIAGIFQVFDGTQVVSIGILRGVGDTRTPMLVAVLGFWLIGLPVSAWLGLATPAGPEGLWWGLVAGLAAVAVFLVTRARQRLRGPIQRLIIDRP